MLLLPYISRNLIRISRTIPGSEFSVGLFLYGARDGRHLGRLRLQDLILQTLVAILLPVVQSGTAEGPFFMCFIRENVRSHRYIS